MTVIDILIMSLGFSDDGGEVQGHVDIRLLDDSERHMALSLHCACQVSKRIRPDALLIGEAIRQLRRLPQIRSGEVRLKFAKGLKPALHDQAA